MLLSADRALKESHHEADCEVADRCYVVRRNCSDHVVGRWRVTFADVFPGTLQRRALEVRAEIPVLRVAALAS